MDDPQIKIECLRLAATQNPEKTLEVARRYYEWVCPAAKAVPGGSKIQLRRKGA